MKYRKEKDFLGEIDVPKNAYYGSFTSRALNNFDISGIKWKKNYIMAIGALKLACCEANYKLGNLTEKQRNSITRACKEVISGNFNDQFPLDYFQAGAGTPFHMNANEVIANRANEFLRGKKGQYKHVHPNDHVNFGQSSNNVVPTAIKIATLEFLDDLKIEIKKVSDTLYERSLEFRDVLKVGRTHLQDAVPISLASEFKAYREYLDRSLKKITHCEKSLMELGIGGTAIGTGISSSREFSRLTVEILNGLTKRNFYSSKNKVYLTQSFESFLELSNCLKFLALSLEKISNDLMLMASGPKAGINEINVPEIEPGSSIMPGKVNPSILECVRMVSFQVEGNCRVIERSFTSEFELNSNAPVVAYNLAFSIEILINSLKMLREKCLKDLKVNKDQIKEYFDKSSVLATAFKVSLGYDKVSQIVRESLRKDKPFLDVLREKKILSEEEISEILRGVKG